MKRYTYYRAFRFGCIYRHHDGDRLYFTCQPAPQSKITIAGIFTDIPGGLYSHSLITCDPQPQLRYF